jgi:Mg/Co/Ni transporter MgtE
MTSEPVILTPDTTVAEALARIREPQLAPAVASAVFVTRAPMATPTGRYLGVVHFQRLLREPPSSLLGGVVDNDIDPLEPSTPLAEITRRMATYNLVAMPVVDSADRLVGAVTVDDVLDHLLPVDWRDRDHDEPLAVQPYIGPAARFLARNGSAGNGVGSTAVRPPAPPRTEGTDGG